MITPIDITVTNARSESGRQPSGSPGRFTAQLDSWGNGMSDKEPKTAATMQVLDTPSPRSWSKLETAGDVRRFFRWLLLEVKRGRMDLKKANSLAFIGGQLLRAVEMADLEQRILAIEAERQGGSNDQTVYIKVVAGNDETA